MLRDHIDDEEALEVPLNGPGDAEDDGTPVGRLGTAPGPRRGAPGRRGGAGGRPRARRGWGGAAGGRGVVPREYVEKLRTEAADACIKAKRADGYASRLQHALVGATGRLADPTDLPFDEANVMDDERLNTAINSLLEAKPHLASRRPRGNIGQGPVSSGDGTVSLAGLRSRAS